MNVALIIEKMAPLRGGREVYVSRLAEALTARGHQATVLCQRCDWPEKPDDVKVAELGQRGRGAAGLATFVEYVERRLGEEAFDVSHAMLPVPSADIYHLHGGTAPGIEAAALRRQPPAVRPFARLIRNRNRRRRLSAEMERRMVEAGKTVWICVSEMVAEEVRRYYSPPAPIRVILNAVRVPDVDDEQRAHWRQRTRYRMGVGPDDPVFISVATNFRLKGIRQAIEAYARWRHRRSHGGARLVIVGRETPEGYRRHASLRDVAGEVVFVPPTRDIFEWYAAADACIVLSWYDPCGLVVLEAVRWGIPAVTTAYNGASEVLGGGAGEVVADPNARSDIVAAMTAVTDAERREDYEAACRRVADSVSLDRHVDALLSVYSEVASR